jgi:hypothetical protein
MMALNMPLDSIESKNSNTGKPDSPSVTDAQLEVYGRSWSAFIGLILIVGSSGAVFAIVMWELEPQRRWVVLGLASLAVILPFAMAKYIVHSAHREMAKERGSYDGKHVIR